MTKCFNEHNNNNNNIFKKTKDFYASTTSNNALWISINSIASLLVVISRFILNACFKSLTKEIDLPFQFTKEPEQEKKL